MVSLASNATSDKVSLMCISVHSFNLSFMLLFIYIENSSLKLQQLAPLHFGRGTQPLFFIILEVLGVYMIVHLSCKDDIIDALLCIICSTLFKVFGNVVKEVDCWRQKNNKQFWLDYDKNFILFYDFLMFRDTMYLHFITLFWVECIS